MKTDITFFCTSGKIDRKNHNYTNAFKSWKNLGINVVLFGPDDDETKNILDEYGINWQLEPELHSDSKLPRLDDLLTMSANLCKTEYMCYINCDIIIFDQFLDTFSFLRKEYNDFFMVGQRWDWYKSNEMNFQNTSVFDFEGKNIVLHAKTGVDYFVLKKTHLENVFIPPFLVPRSRWDHWFAGVSKRVGIPLVDTTATNIVVQPEPEQRLPLHNEPYKSELLYNENLYRHNQGCDISGANVKTIIDSNKNIVIAK